MLTIKDLSVKFPSRFGDVTAIEDVDLKIRPGEIHGLVGESGAGKSTVGAAVIGLISTPGYIAKGEITLGDTDLRALTPEQAHAVRGDRISMIFQDPQTSLNPLMTVEDQLIETIQTHSAVSYAEAQNRAVDLLEEIGIKNAAERIKSYPHQFSGGMRQRVVIALALCTDPELIIADEPTTALDVAVQQQVLDLLRDLADRRNIA
ncbi:MAG: ABC transporter ATP-binding protein, partial [Pseudomonadota bacterium]